MVIGKNNKSNNTSIITINPTTLLSYKFFNHKITPQNINKISQKKEIFSSFIYSKDILSGIIEINKRIEDKDIKEAIELEAYETLELDLAVEYKIIYLEANINNNENRIFNVFAFDTSVLQSIFKNIHEKTKYIDYISATPFLPIALYRKNILENKGVDCFIYFQKEDAFLAAYKNGEYLYSKSLNYSLYQMYEKFCTQLGERVKEQDFFTFLTNEGLNTSNISYQETLMQLFSEIFLHINNVIIFFKRSYNVQTINRVFLGSEIGEIQGADVYSKSYLDFETLKFDFNNAKNKKELPIDQMHVLLMLCVQVYQENLDQSLNLTIFQRPPPFFKRVSGKIILFLAASIILSLAYPAYNYIYGYILNKQVQTKQKEYRELYTKTQRLRTSIEQLTESINQTTQILQKENKKLDFRKKLLNEIYLKKVKYPMKAQMLQNLIKIINNKNIKITKIIVNNKEVITSLQSQSDKQLTELLKEISKTGKYSVRTKKIIQKKDKTFYISDIKTKIK